MAAGPPFRRWARLARQDMGLGAIAALAMALYAVFLVVPVLLSLKTSFTNQNILFPGSNFVGLANYTRMLHDPEFFASLEFTLGLALGATVVANVVGLAFAILLNRTSLSYRILRTIAFGCSSSEGTCGQRFCRIAG
jgi:ABC-type sugar transport system permease subunit